MKKNAITAKYRRAGLAASVTKGALERTRAALMAAWTREHGKDDPDEDRVGPAQAVDLTTERTIKGVV
jgi:hypothetical protein